MIHSFAIDSMNLKSSIEFQVLHVGQDFIPEHKDPMPQNPRKSKMKSKELKNTWGGIVKGTFSCPLWKEKEENKPHDRSHHFAKGILGKPPLV